MININKKNLTSFLCLKCTFRYIFMCILTRDAIFKCVFFTIKQRSQDFVLQKNTLRRRLAGNPIQVTLLLFEIECFEVTQLQKNHISKRFKDT
jgi:hypothetical protein